MCAVYVTFVFLLIATTVRDRFPQTRGSMEADEYGLTRGMCFVAHRLEVVAVAGLLWISWCVLGAAGFRVFWVFFCSNAHGLLQVGGRLASFTSLLVVKNTEHSDKCALSFAFNLLIFRCVYPCHAEPYFRFSTLWRRRNLPWKEKLHDGREWKKKSANWRTVAVPRQFRCRRDIGNLRLRDEKLKKRTQKE